MVVKFEALTVAIEICLRQGVGHLVTATECLPKLDQAPIS